MARQARMSVAAYPHHLIQRGHNRADVFIDDSDRQRYLEILRDAAHEHKVAVHAYVLMSNHVHLLATPETDDGLSRMMQSLGRRYVGWFNHKHQRTGTLWEGRFRSHLIDADAYLLSCLRYIELNPQRAGLVSGLLDHPWSSMAHHLGQRRDPLVTDHPAFWQLGNTPFEREAAYRLWLEEGVPESERQRLTDSLLKAQPLGSPRFLRQLAQTLERPLTPKPRGRPRKPPAAAAAD